MKLLLILATIAFMIFIYDFIGYIVLRFFKIKSIYKVPIGFVALLASFQIVTFPLMYLHASFSIVMFLIVPCYAIIIGYLLYKNYQEYFSTIKEDLKKFNFWFYIVISLLCSIFVILLTVTEIDQVLYTALTSSTVINNIIYYNDGYNTILTDPATNHGLESLYLLNAVWIKLFCVDVIEYIFGLYRIVEVFIIVGIFGLINQLYLNNKWHTLSLFLVGIAGFNLLSQTQFLQDDFTLLFAGNSGTLLLHVFMAPLLLIYFKLKEHRVIYFLMYTLFALSISYSAIPMVVMIVLIISLVEKNNKTAIYTMMLLIISMIFYIPNILYILFAFVSVAIIYVLRNKLEKLWILSYTAYGAIILVFIVMLFKAKVPIYNEYLVYTFGIVFVYYLLFKENKKIWMFSGLMLVFLFFFKGAGANTFAITVINLRMTIFIMMPFLFISILNKSKILSYGVLAICVCYVAAVSILGKGELHTKNVIEYISDLNYFGTHRSVLIANRDTEELIKYPFENNADIYFYKAQDPTLSKKNKYEDSYITTINKYLGRVNIYKEAYYKPHKDFCTKTDDCYVIVNKQDMDDSKFGEVVLETDSLLVFKYKKE